MTPVEICIEFLKFYNNEKSEYMDALVNEGLSENLFKQIHKLYKVPKDELLETCMNTDWGDGFNPMKCLNSPENVEKKLEEARKFMENYAIGMSKDTYKIISKMKMKNLMRETIMDAIHCNEFDIDAADFYVTNTKSYSQFKREPLSF